MAGGGVMRPTGDEILEERRRAPTARQKAVLDFIVQYTRREGSPPTLREIGKAFGIRSTNGVNDHLRALERKGYIRRRDMLSRSIVVLDGQTGGPADSGIINMGELSLREENRALRELLRRVVSGARSSPTMSAHMAIVIGDVQAVLRGS
jgi:repressor LexA